MSTHQFLPWQHSQRDHLFRQYRSGRMAHAYLFHGPAGTGKTKFAEVMTGLLLCQHPSESDICGKCRSCQLLSGGYHPDVLHLQVEEGKQIVGIDKVRASVDFISKTSNQGGLRIVIVPNAEALNVNASNALLKTLEEPPANTLICLVTDNPALLLPTLRSRCQNISFPVPERKQALEWLSVHIERGNAGILLNLARGAPLKALEYSDPEWVILRERVLGLITNLLRGNLTVTAAMSDLDKIPLETLMEILMLTTKELILALSAGVTEADDSAFQVLKDAIPEGGSTALHVYHDGLIRIKRDLQRGLSLNPRLAIFELLKGWQNILAGSAVGSGSSSRSTLNNAVLIP